MGTTTPRALQNAAFFIVGKMFCLRGGNELRNLKLSQIVLLHNPDNMNIMSTFQKHAREHSKSFM